jgi:hypothetical protein
MTLKIKYVSLQEKALEKGAMRKKPHRPKPEEQEGMP